MKILGLDPGLRVTGYGVIEKTGQRLHYVASGVIRTREGELPSRIKTVFEGVVEILAHFQPDAAAVEKVFVNVNPQSTLLLGQARGACLAALMQASQPVFEYTALQVKQAVVGNGHADKVQVQHMVKRLLNLPAEPRRDSADALACAICHAHGGLGFAGVVTSPRRRAGRML
ncbi:MAG TPA: crossover junction endodeoxyribonuclease RuvC [Thiobacillaceae bacterium]|nr:crossover junction endodeoxyribonuclease RuvC [Thiobacillaceae bacterium]HNU64081.1 crossover junction endodeoxyribonuclease RuvC [Thiobacillaceae bacterium]